MEKQTAVVLRNARRAIADLLNVLGDEDRRQLAFQVGQLDQSAQEIVRVLREAGESVL